MARSISVNGKQYPIDVDDDTPLLWVLRDVLGMTGTKFGCGVALCGACTVHIDGVARRSCVTPVGTLERSSIQTIETLDSSPAGRAVQQAWLDNQVVQCGYCQSGQLMSASALLSSNPKPSNEDINATMSGNICRCGTYGRIRAAIKQASNDLASASQAQAGSGAKP